MIIAALSPQASPLQTCQPKSEISCGLHLLLLVIFHCLRPFISITILRFNLRQLTLLIGLITFHLRAARRAFAVTRWEIGPDFLIPELSWRAVPRTGQHCCYSAWVASLPLNPWFSSRVATSREPSRDDAMPRPIAITLMSLAFVRCRDGDYVHQSGSALEILSQPSEKWLPNFPFG